MTAEIMLAEPLLRRGKFVGREVDSSHLVRLFPRFNGVSTKRKDRKKSNYPGLGASARNDFPAKGSEPMNQGNDIPCYVGDNSLFGAARKSKFIAKNPLGFSS